jgi:putative tricarboxylic transport membrane protein
MRGSNHDFTVNNNKVVDQIFNIFWVLLGIGICIESIRLQLWNPAGPGSGFIPFLTGLLIGIIGFLLFLSEWSKGSKQEEAGKFWENPIARNRVFYLLASLCFMALLMRKLGFLLSSIFITIFMIRVIEPRRWSTLIFVSVVSCLSIYFLFKYAMQINLPKGLLGF